MAENFNPLEGLAEVVSWVTGFMEQGLLLDFNPLEGLAEVVRLRFSFSFFIS